MTRTRFTAVRRLRRGFTLIELLVVISIIAVLASLIAPAVQSARRTARKMECLNNIRQVGIAMQSFASANNGQLPSLVGTMKFANSLGANVTLSAGWPIQIMPAMDGSAVVKNLKAYADIDAVGVAAPNTGFGVGVGNNRVTEKVYFKGFSCPDDVSSDKIAGGLSYAVNMGMISNTIWTTYAAGAVDTFGSPSVASTGFHHTGLIRWDGTTPIGSNQNQAIGLASGVFQRDLTNINGVTVVAPSPYTVMSTAMSLDYVSTGDGTTNTLMLSENLQAGDWWSTSANQLGFGIQVPVNSDVPSLPGWVVGTGLNLDATGYDTLVGDASFINRNLTALPGYAPRPSSQHANGVNVIFCDGSGRFLTENMDKKVYAKLVTSNGVAYGEQTLNASY